MAYVVVWIDREHAKIFNLSQEKMQRTQLDSTHVDHHTHRRDAVEVAKQERHFFASVAGHLEDATKILILGPGMAKHHFQTYLTEQDPGVAKKIAGCETVDHPTDAQVAAAARRFFSSSFV